jgi:hypothetical protein
VFIRIVFIRIVFIRIVFIRIGFSVCSDKTIPELNVTRVANLLETAVEGLIRTYKRLGSLAVFYVEQVA